jgi:Protein of unknown function (DUF3422)
MPTCGAVFATPEPRAPQGAQPHLRHMKSAHFTLNSDQLPPDDAQRMRLHNEVHVRPLVAITAPALVVYLAVVNDGISCADECDHLRALPGQAALELAQLKDN